MVIAVDIGGTSVKSALVELRAGKWRIAERGDPVLPNGRAVDDLKHAVIQAVARLLSVAGRDQLTVGIATTGSVDRNGTLISGGFYDGYPGTSWDAVLSNELPSRVAAVTVVNDGRASAWGSYIDSFRERTHNLVHIVVGTGIGAGIVANGQLLHGEHNLAGYLGHIKVVGGSTVQCVCGRFGCVETVAAGPALLTAALRASAVEPKLAAVRDVAQLSRLARAGVAEARAIIIAGGEWLGRAIADVCNLIDPGVVAIGGGVVIAGRAVEESPEAGNWYVDAAARSARELAVLRIANSVEILEAPLLNDGGLIGVAALTGVDSR